MTREKLTKAQHVFLDHLERNGGSARAIPKGVQIKTIYSLVRRGEVEEPARGPGVITWFITDAGRAALKGDTND